MKIATSTGRAIRDLVSDLSQDRAQISKKKRAGKVTKYTAAILSKLNQADPQVASTFLKQFEKNLILAWQDNKGAIKPAAHQALNDLVLRGLATLEEVKKITHFAWKLVYKDAAKAKPKAHKISAPSTMPSIYSENRSNFSQRIEAPQGFLWKPIADSPPHGLAILLPPAWTGQIEGLQIIDPENGQVLANGQDGGVGNGDRQHFRFKNKGADFPDGAIVRVYLNNGSIREITIGDSSARIEG